MGTIPKENMDPKYVPAQATQAGKANHLVTSSDDPTSKVHKGGLVSIGSDGSTQTISKIGSTHIDPSFAPTHSLHAHTASIAMDASMAAKIKTDVNGVVRTTNKDGTIFISPLMSDDIPNHSADTTGNAATASKTARADKATKAEKKK